MWGPGIWNHSSSLRGFWSHTSRDVPPSRWTSIRIIYTGAEIAVCTDGLIIASNADKLRVKSVNKC